MQGRSARCAAVYDTKGKDDLLSHVDDFLEKSQVGSHRMQLETQGLVLGLLRHLLLQDAVPQLQRLHTTDEQRALAPPVFAQNLSVHVLTR